jgi:hypothetical protein
MMGRRGLVLGLAAVLVIGVLAGWALWHRFQIAQTGPFVDTVERFRDDVALLKGVDCVADAEERAGDLTGRTNAFVRVISELPIDSPALRDLAEAIAERSAAGQSATRIMPVLITGTASVALTPEPSFNEQRLNLANDLLTVDGVESVRVLWTEQNDDLIFDLSNTRLDIFVQGRSGSPANLSVAAAQEISRSFPDASITATVRTDGGHERTVRTENGLGAEALDEFVQQLEAEPEVLAYSIGELRSRIYIQQGSDPAPLAARLRLLPGSMLLTIDSVNESDPHLDWEMAPLPDAVSGSQRNLRHDNR